MADIGEEDLKRVSADQALGMECCTEATGAIGERGVETRLK